MPKVLPAEGTTLPANYTTIGIHGCIDHSSIAFSVERDGSSTPIEFDEVRPIVEVPFMDQIVETGLHWTSLDLRAQLTAGDTLLLRYQSEHDETGWREVEVRWPVGEEEQLPEQLGTLDVRKHQGVIKVSANVSCSRAMSSSYADVELQPAAQARAWLPRIRYELNIDGVPWLYYEALSDQHDTGTWHSALGRGRDRIVLGCEVEPHQPVIHDAYPRPQALEPGPHRVRMVGLLASGEELSSEEVIVDMQCAPDSARALKAELAALQASRADAQRSDEPAADGGDVDAGCAAVSLGSTRASGWPAAVLAVFCLARLGRMVRRARGVYSRERITSHSATSGEHSPTDGVYR